MIVAGLLALCAAAALSWFSAVVDARIARFLTTAAWLLTIAAATTFLVAGGYALAGHPQQVRLRGLDGLGPATLTIDALSGLFLVIAFGVAIPALIAAAAPANLIRPRLAAAIAAGLAAMAVIVTADNFFVLLFGWEALTVAFYFLAGYDRTRAGRDVGSVTTAFFGRASGAALLIGSLLLAGRTHSFAFVRDGVDPHSTLAQAAYAMLLLGFAIKVGLVPAHVWMPPGYSAAPGPARAVMAGAAVNVGFYGMWRTLDVMGPPPTWLTCTVLIVGGLTAILGIAHAAVNPDLTRLVSWSSVENAGVITAGFGAALVGATAGNTKMIAAGLVAATAQAIAHALGKTTLFVATTAIEEATGTTDLDRLGGVTRRLPWAGTALVIGSFTLAGLPLTAGFASEWFTLESLMQQFRVSSLALQLSTAVAGALVALTIGMAAVTFVRLVALTAFGPARLNEPHYRSEGRELNQQWWYRLAVGLLVLGCLGAAALAPLMVRMIAAGLTPIVGDQAGGANAAPWVLQPVFADFSALSPTWLWIVLPALVVVITAVAALFAGRIPWRARRAPAWSSASPGVDRGVGYTSFAYANPVRQVLSTVLLTRTELSESTTQTSSGAVGYPFTYRVHVVDIVERYGYRPLIRGVLWLSRVARRLQSGRLDAYMAYMLLAVLAVLAVVIATA
ncbi:NADH/ubiquinone/plastoquinone (Complex I) [uncultured Mycobacterium sp.]|uniref:NADH/ubiquinone/plastoquinone (Complex I) n=1 Tax=uncultured Mycobacterium sp. TaxID=171292 RepID=A0A1Y5PQI2_9MYCO|nr:NADH/ubiquinone/plastoquinone (Complex I) [uncultured Mycobacterium sp.]